MSRRLPIHVALFLLTLFTTTLVGASFAEAFRHNQPVDFDRTFNILFDLRSHAGILATGLPYSLTLLAILMAHEMGHYVVCRYYGIDATLPYFLPAPTLIGTLGAFIWIRSPIYSKRALFDVGVAGPLAGFACLLPVLAAGLAMSKTLPGVGVRGDLIFGTPAAIRFFEWIFFPGVPSSDIYLHPVARAAWVGLLATALNLLPIGQLDGGHIIYAFFGEKHRVLSRIFIAALIPLGIFFSWSWLVWAVLLFVFARRHPVIVDPSRPGPVRAWLAWLSLAIFLLSFTVVPVRTAP